jgi:hypothetical protein
MYSEVCLPVGKFTYLLAHERGSERVGFVIVKGAPFPPCMRGHSLKIHLKWVHVDRPVGIGIPTHLGIPTHTVLVLSFQCPTQDQSWLVLLVLLVFVLLGELLWSKHLFCLSVCQPFISIGIPSGKPRIFGGFSTV